MWNLTVDFHTYYCSTQTSYTLTISTRSKLIRVKCNVHIISGIFMVIDSNRNYTYVRFKYILQIITIIY